MGHLGSYFFFLEEVVFFADFLRTGFFGTFAPLRRASDNAIAIACFRLVTFCPELLRKVPRFRSRITVATLREAFLL